MTTTVGLVPTDTRDRYRLEVERSDCAEHGILYAGVALASAVEAVEATTERQVRWATVQLARAVTAPATLDLTVHLDHVGRRSTQARVVAEHDGAPALLALAAASVPTDDAPDYNWCELPADLMNLPRHEPRPVGGPDTSHHRFDVAADTMRSGEELDGRFDPTGRSGMWVRLRGRQHDRAAELALMVDASTWALQHAIGAQAPVLTYDNTIRIVRTEPTDWVLLELTADAVADGFAHATARLWSEAGSLLAIGSQTARLSRVTEAREYARMASERRRTRALWDDLLDGALTR